MPTAIKLFDAQTANGNSEEFTTNGSAYLKILGTFDGCAVKLQIITNNEDDSFSNTGDTITDVGSFKVPYSPNCRYRLNLSSAGASTSVDAFVSQ